MTYLPELLKKLLSKIKQLNVIGGFMEAIKKPKQVKQDIYPAGDLRNSLEAGETFRSELVMSMYPFSSLALHRIMMFKNGKAQPEDFRNGFYWKDNHNTGGVGPFSGEYMAIEHWKAYKLQLREIVRMREDGVTPQSANVLQLDSYRNKPKV